MRVIYPQKSVQALSYSENTNIFTIQSRVSRMYTIQFRVHIIMSRMYATQSRVYTFMFSTNSLECTQDSLN